jgi:hypothetical protein
MNSPARRAAVAAIAVADLADGRRQLVVDVVMPDGRPARLTVDGDCFVPVADDLGVLHSVVVEFVPRPAPVRGGVWSTPPRRAAVP